MTPLTSRKLLWVGSVVVVGGLAVLGLVAAAGGAPGPVHLGVAALVLLVPGRVNGWLWRDLYAGRRLLDADDPAGAEAACTRALAGC